MMKPNEPSNHQRLSDLLRQLGLDLITVDQFWNEMARYGLTDEDIDRFCAGEKIK